MFSTRTEMGRLVAQVPNEDPERLKRVLDAKWRTIGVGTQTAERYALLSRTSPDHALVLLL